MGKGMTIIRTSQARLVPPRAKYIDSVSIQVPSMLLSHSAIILSTTLSFSNGFCGLTHCYRRA